MLHGPAGAGKTFLLTQLAQYLGAQDDVVKIHLGEQTDAKLLLGTYTLGEKPGSFEWRAGVLTSAVREGKWVLVEDIDKAPTEVLSILLTLLEKRELSIPSRGEIVRAHSGFQLLSTVRTAAGARVPDMIGLRMWRRVGVVPPGELELRAILAARFPLLRNLIPRLIAVYAAACRLYALPAFVALNRGLHPRVVSTRDLMKVCLRCHTMLQNKGVVAPDQLLEAQVYDDIFAEAVECFGSALTEYAALRPLVAAVGEVLEVPHSRISLYLESHVPTFFATDTRLEIGRATLAKSPVDHVMVKRKPGATSTFARTKHAKRLMEQIGVAVQMAEPILLVGETGTGKTTVVQEVAKMMHKKLTVINVSQQTEAGDLLGGYKPVNTKSVATPLQEVFETLFLATFSQKKNGRFSALLAKCFNKNQWKNVARLWHEAVKMAHEVLAALGDTDDDAPEEGAPKKRRRLRASERAVLLAKWEQFQHDVRGFEAQAANLEQAFVFSFVEGSLVKAVRNGDWLLLDEINLASPDTLESIADLLSEHAAQRSVLLSERGDVEAIQAHEEFRIFGCMNPSTDIGKRDLPQSIRSRFSEVYVHSPDRDREDLTSIIEKYIHRFAVGDDWAIEDIAELYYEAKALAEANRIVDGANQKPHFSIRTLTRTLIYVCDIVSVYGLRRALYEGFCMSFLTLLDRTSEEILRPIIAKYTVEKLKNAKQVIARCPPPPSNDDGHVQFKHYWLKRGPGETSTPNYIITPFVEKNLLNLVRATASRKFPVLVQGPTSAGKTSMINYLASITGHKFVRINNHEHTDLQEYLGTYISDSSGKLVFREGVLVEALRKGHWIVLDELNLAPTDVLEALNRLLDDNRELFIPETQEVIHPHPDFMLFATQNPPGLYGGRKVLSRAFRNRFLELHFDDIPQDELEVILRERCKIAPTYGKKIVEVYRQLSVRRQSSRLFEQKNSFATLRDLFRWALRDAVGYEELAANGYMLLAERVRSQEEKLVVKETIEKVMRVSLNMDEYYERLENKQLMNLELPVVWTKAMRRLAVLVEMSIKYKEPLLLVGETGCGKTTVCQILAQLLKRELITVNAHQNTETGDILGAQRPIRNRFETRAELLKALLVFFDLMNIDVSLEQSKVEDLIKQYERAKKTLAEAPNSAVSDDLLANIDEGIRASSSLFEWADGPLINAMKQGEFFLLDEISLADDSVLERLNSVLEPERSLLLAEKGSEDSFLAAQETFQFLATMNPGGDYGKKELSPALRNRFTEIWVPSMDDFRDVQQIVESRLRPEHRHLSEPLVKFSEWFGKRLGNGNANSGVISLRDILAWVEFINACDLSFSDKLALINGAMMVFIDALGTNNTAYLADTEERLLQYKQECLEMLCLLIGSNPDEHSLSASSIVEVGEEYLKAGLFLVPRKPNQDWEELFNLLAPTTAANAMRVIRAMQVHKPILLEGSPGVGKTSLISAISKATGNPLIRINLSEQTDLIDLFGSDAPVEGGNTGEFVWRDAPFLRAMKNGEWVLLDEMNLASQSVLEGLNACLDHRGEAYIPELDRSFPRHPQFKVFAAQNPQYQGGGRKGLPKSFVNRFSVVYMDVLKNEDLMLISAQIFPNIPRDDCSKMISFMTKLEEEVVVQKKWGMSGGPWEFNLRDTLRWLALYSSKHNLCTSSDNTVGDFLDMIVCHRFRTQEDRQHVKELFESIFGPQKKNDNFYGLGKEYVQAGGSLMRRNSLLQFSNSSDRLQFVTLQTNFPILESAMRSVNENIPLILTGPSNAGKTELIRFLANVVGVKLSEFSMNSDVDSMDILGGYEQVDLTRSINAITIELSQLLNELVVVNLKATESDPLSLQVCLELFQYMEDTEIGSENFPDFLAKLKRFLTFYSSEKLESILSSAVDLQSKLQEVSTVRFNWFDGMLVKAVARGEWLVLDNANLCNPSVLDRLNSLLEFNGSLIINECSQEDGSPRVLKPHPNFRLFLTVDPKYGELSRAMRNRCVEVYLDKLENRATDFDKRLLGMPVIQETAEDYNADHYDLTLYTTEIIEVTHLTRPLSLFVSSTDSCLRQLALIHDCVTDDSVSCLAGALVGIFGLSQFGMLKKWAKAFNSPEFGLAESERLEQVFEILQHLQATGYVSNVKALYGQTASSLVVTRDFAKNQVLHPLVNGYISSFLNNCGFNLEGTNTSSIFQVAASILNSKFFIKKVEDKAINGKASDLSFIERSAAVALGREIKRVPKINIFGYVKAVSQFISNIFDASMNFSEFFQQPSKFYEGIIELQCIWFSLAEASHEQNLSKLRVYHGMISSWLETHQDLSLIANNAREITSLRVGLELTSGFSMTKIWEHFRQTYPTSKKAWDNYAKLLALLGDFDILSRKLYPDTYEEVSALRNQMLSLYEDIVSDSLEDEDISIVFTNFADAFKKLANVADAFVVERDNQLEEEFTMLSNFMVVNSYLCGENLQDQLSVASFSSKPSFALLQSSKTELFAPYPRLFDCLWSKESFTRGLFTNLFLQLSFKKINGIKNRPGKFLDQSLTDISAFARSLVQNSNGVLQDQKSIFQSILYKWVIEILKAHDLEITPALCATAPSNKAEIAILFELIQTGCDDTIVGIMKETFMPALYLTINKTSLAQLGKAWILFASGCIQLFVPNSPLDPAIEDHVSFSVHQRQQLLCDQLAESWKTIRSVISGNEPLQLELLLPSSGEIQELSKSPVYRSNESMDEVFDEWKAFMDSAIDTEPISKLLAAAELSTIETNLQKVGIFHNNSANFMMRLNSKYPMYADLNDILNGYIYSIRLGLDLLNIDNQNKASLFPVASLWQVNIESLNDVPAIESMFESVKTMNKTLGSSSIMSEKVMLFFINLCFAQTKKGDEKLVSVINQAFQSLYYRWYYRKMKQEEIAAQEGSLYKHRDTDDAEQDFKDLFPDFEDVMDLNEESSKPTEAFEEIHYELALSYVNHYLNKKQLSLSEIVEQGSLLCSELQPENSGLIHGTNNASHLSALLVAMKASHDQFATELDVEVNFYHDPCPSQFKRAMKVVLGIYNSVASLLAQWPEHATLQTISRYADEFLTYPSSFPMNKLLFKIEILHNSLNEWEKFASSQVSLKTHFEEITNLIVSWRKLELASWKCLFTFENNAFRKSIGKWWFHLFDSVVIPYLLDDEGDEDMDEKPSVVQVLGALNVFMSQTNFGEFEPRLDLVKALRNHIAGLSNAESDILNGLGNFISFYNQFTPIIKESISQTRKSLEKDVSEIILLASWKDVNIDALKQSSRKSHNNLFKLVRKYRDLLSTPVAPIVEAGISKDSAVELGHSSEPRHLRYADLSKTEKLAILQACQATARWNERPARLKNIEIVENNLKIYIEKILKSLAPSLYAYTKQIIEQMDLLRKETPSVMNEETKKMVAALKTQKHKLLSDTFKELRRIGVKTTIKPEVKKALATVNLILTNGSHLNYKSISGIDAHYFRCLDILPRLRSSVASGNEEVPQADLERGLAASENLMLSLVSTRTPLTNLAGSVERISVLCENMMTVAQNSEHTLVRASVVPSMEYNLTEMTSFASNLIRVLEYALDVSSSASYFHSSVDSSIFVDAKSEFTSILSSLPDESSRIYTEKEVKIVSEFRASLDNLLLNLQLWAKRNSETAFISEVVIKCINNLCYKPFLNSSTSLTSLAVIEDLEVELRSLSTSIMVSVQKILELYQEVITDEDDGWLSITQQRLMKSIKLLHSGSIERSLEKCIELVHKIEHNSHTSTLSSALVSFTKPLIVQYHNLSVSLLSKTKQNYIEMAKSTFVLLKALHTLATDGFCSPELPSEQKKDDNLHDGTGLGDGEGATNNSKDEEEDDDLAEHAQQPNEEKNKDEEDDENDDAVDMEGDMAGDLEETSDQDKDDEDKDEGDDEDDLDEEVDDIDDLDPNAIDEKMWDEEAKEDDKEKDSDKMPQNSVNDDDNMEANEEEEKENPDQKEDDSKDDQKDGDEENDDDAENEEDVGEQEDDVKNEENEQLDDHVPETETLDLPDDMNLDEEEDDENDEGEEENQYDDKMDIEEEEEEKDQAQEDQDGDNAEAVEDQNEGEGSDNDVESEEDGVESEMEGGEKDVDEEAQEMDSEEDIADAPQDEDKKEDDQENAAENGEEAVEGEEGANNQDNDEEVDMDSATRTEAGEQGDGADNQAMEEKDDVGASGTASSDMKQEDHKEEDKAPNDDGARDEMKESLKQLGDTLKEFHRRRQEIKEASLDENQQEDKADVKPDEFQHVDGENTENDTQALGAADNKDQVQSIDEDMAIDEEEDESAKLEEDAAQVKNEDDMDIDEKDNADQDQVAEDAEDFEGKTKGGIVGERRHTEEPGADDVLQKQELEETVAEQELDAYREDDFVINREDVPAMSLDHARQIWRDSEIATQELASGLSEQLRLILEPTLATKLRGDYKTGKRLNMKRIISYIASDFRKDKIWLRRTKPAKRQYQIMIAVDDSKSMTESKSTELAFHSIALVSKALTQLESGGLSIVRFGEDVKLVHPFDKPFNQETGANVFQWFDFQQERTDIKQLCSKSLKIFENARSTSSSDLWQLQIIISDGVCEDHATVQRLVRKAREEKVMLVFVVVDGITSNESILEMSQVSYVPDPVTGIMSLKVENYLDTFPFEFYVVVRNINELPEMLSLILRQYFSEVANM